MYVRTDRVWKWVFNHLQCPKDNDNDLHGDLDDNARYLRGVFLKFEELTRLI